MAAEKVETDPFCWQCCGENHDLMCITCIRSFHYDCANVKRTTAKNENWICPVCVKPEETNSAKELEILPKIVSRVYNDKSYNTLKNASYAKGRFIIRPINLTTLNEDANSYKSFDELLDDANWIVHNCQIAFSDKNEKTKTARILFDYLAGEIESVKICADCYLNANEKSENWFTMVCDEPHLVVWAKMKGFNLWPAKLMSIDGQLIHVRFFYDHKNADVPATSCYLYSKEAPIKLRKYSVNYKKALKEADQYIANISQKFGSFRLVDEKTAFNPAEFEKHKAHCIPGLADYRRQTHAMDENRMESSEEDSFEDCNNDFGEDEMGSEDLEDPSEMENDGATEQPSVMSPQPMELKVNLYRIDANEENIKKNVENMASVEDDAVEEDAVDTVEDDAGQKNVADVAQTSGIAGNDGKNGATSQIINSNNKRSATFEVENRTGKKVRFCDDGRSDDSHVSLDVDSDDSSIESQGNSFKQSQQSVTVEQLVAELSANLLKSPSLKQMIEHVCMENIKPLFNENKKLHRQLSNMKRVLNNSVQRNEALEETNESLRKANDILEQKVSKHVCDDCEEKIDMDNQTANGGHKDF